MVYPHRRLERMLAGRPILTTLTPSLMRPSRMLSVAVLEWAHASTFMSRWPLALSPPRDSLLLFRSTITDSIAHAVLVLPVPG